MAVATVGWKRWLWGGGDCRMDVAAISLHPQRLGFIGDGEVGTTTMCWQQRRCAGIGYGVVVSATGKNERRRLSGIRDDVVEVASVRFCGRLFGCGEDFPGTYDSGATVTTVG